MDPLQEIDVGAAANDGTGDPLRDAFIKVNENFAVVALNDTQGTSTLTGDKIIDGDLTHSLEFNDLATLTLDATSLNLAGVTNVSLASTGAGVGQGEVEIRADQQFRILTPAVVAQTATEGQTLQLVDAINGIVEFGDQDQDSTIIGWAASGAYAITSATRDSDGVITTASVSWPDGSTGTFTRTTKNTTFLTIDAYTVTHTDSGNTATQSTVTRDTVGNITAQPAITIA